MSLLRAEPDRMPWAQARPPGACLRTPSPGLAPGQGPGNPPGWVHKSLFVFFRSSNSYWIVQGKSLFLFMIFYFLMNHTDPLSHLAQDYIQSLESKLNTEDRYLVFIPRAYGTNSQTTTLSSFKSELKTFFISHCLYCTLTFTLVFLKSFIFYVSF